MCGRYQFSVQACPALAGIARRAGQSPQGGPPTGDICPTQTAPVLTARGGQIAVEMQKWGMRRYGKTIINARAETVATKPMFRRDILARRCAVPASAYYEWDAGRHKYRFTRPGQALYLAGIYDVQDDGRHFVVLTTAPNPSVHGIHDRMPLILRREDVRPWLTDSAAALKLLADAPPLLERTAEDGQLSFGDLMD